MKKLTQSELTEYLVYNHETGAFQRPNGDACGSVNNYGYVRISVKGLVFKAHQLAWLYVTGSWPEQPIDHINGIRNDNRFSNLRLASASQNRVNSSVRSDSNTGFKGVSQRPSGRWRAQIRIDGIAVNLGTFDTAEQAQDAYQKAATETHGEFVRPRNDPPSLLNPNQGGVAV